MSKNEWEESATESAAATGESERKPVAGSRQSPEELLYGLAHEALKEKRRTRRWKLFFRGAWLLLFVVIVVSLLVHRGEHKSATMSGKFVAVVNLNGPIANDSDASASRVIKGLDAAYKSNAQAIVLHINSPGGTPVQAARIYNEVMRLRNLHGKPIYAVIEDLGASGAYYAAAGANRIYAAPASLVGSIGVIYSGFGFHQAMSRLGIERRVFTAGDNKDFLDPFKDVTPQQKAFWQKVLDETHQEFINDVKKGRGNRLGNDPELFSGLVFNGREAKKLGLIDDVATFDEVVRNATGDASRYRDFTPRRDALDRLGKRLGVMAMQALGVETATDASPLSAEFKQ